MGHGPEPGGAEGPQEPLPNDEDRLRALYEKLTTHGSLMVVVDQSATIGARPVALAQNMGITVGYLRGPCLTPGVPSAPPTETLCRR